MNVAITLNQGRKSIDRRKSTIDVKRYVIEASQYRLEVRLQLVFKFFCTILAGVDHCAPRNREFLSDQTYKSRLGKIETFCTDRLVDVKNVAL